MQKRNIYQNYAKETSI